MKDGNMRFKVVEVGVDTVDEINAMDNAFEVKAKAVPELRDGTFSYSIVDVPVPYTKFYPDDEDDYSTFIGNPDKTVFLACSDDTAVGQIILKRWWNRFAWVGDIRVGSGYRRSGIGKVLMDAAVGWARANGYPGIKLETQDTNVPACSFYGKYGFILAGIDTMLYHATENAHETAMFWYLPF